jgi:hypothetical protein
MVHIMQEVTFMLKTQHLIESLYENFIFILSKKHARVTFFVVFGCKHGMHNMQRVKTHVRM